MAYQTGTAADPDSLLDAFRSFLAANGWTINRWTGPNASPELCVSKGQVFANMRALNNQVPPSKSNSGSYPADGIALVGSTGYDGAAAWTSQPGRVEDDNGTSAESVGLYEVNGQCTYHFFTTINPDMAMMVVEVIPGVFHHLGFGDLVKLGAFTGGQYVTASFAYRDYIYTTNQDYTAHPYDQYVGIPFNDSSYYPGAFIRADYDGFTGWSSVAAIAASPNQSKTAQSVFIGNGTYNELRHYYNLIEANPISFNGRTPMEPTMLLVNRGSGFMSPVGITEHIRHISMAGFAPAEIISYGADQWMVFPAHSKGLHSGNKGYAVRKVA